MLMTLLSNLKKLQTFYKHTHIYIYTEAKKKKIVTIPDHALHRSATKY